MLTNRFYFIVLIALVIFLGYLSFLILKPFLIPIAWAIVLSIVFYPLYAFIIKYIKWRSLASLLTLIIILLIILGPVSYFFYLLVSELKTFAAHLETGRAEALKEVLQHPSIRPLVDKVLSLFKYYRGGP